MKSFAKLALYTLSAGMTIVLAAPPNRVLVKVDNGRRVFLTGHVHPKAQTQYDQGRVAQSLALTHLTLDLKPSAQQQADLDQLLVDQQNPSSADYHRWLTPEEFGARFGASDGDLNQTTAWLQSQGFTVTGTARARNYVTFDGSAANVESAFRTELHQFVVDGETHFANTTEPSIPAALQPVVRNIRGLHDFRIKPRLRVRDLTPLDTLASGHHYIAPDDFATIYNLKPLYAAGFDGTGQKLVIVGQTRLRLTDLQQFRTLFNLPGTDPTVQLVPNTRDPGIISGDLQEADLDLEWSSAVARKATILYVYSNDVFASMQYAIDQNLAPVVSMSYGECELSIVASDTTSLRAAAQQANSQGITWFNASGDAGAADCAGQSTDGRLSADFPGSVPEVTAIGGTEFAEGTGTFWNSTNGANSASALSYIPEIAWNDSILDGSPSSSGGGASIFFTKPPWQTGAGVPSDGARDVPDIALNASADHDGYDVTMSGKIGAAGGTSAPTPMFAGIAAILNQYLLQQGKLTTAGLGNMNPKLYTLAQSSPNVFHDITSGNNIVTVACGRRVCPTAPTPVGFNAGPGYDQVTGLGSVDVYNLFLAWSGETSNRQTPQLSVSASATTLAAGASTVLTATIAGSSGTAPTGSIMFLLGTTALGGANLTGANLTGAGGTATLTLAASQLPAGASNITAQYNSDNSTFSNASASVTLNVAQDAAGLTLSGIADGASFQHSYAPGQVLSIFGSQLAAAAQTASSVPLPSTLGGVVVTIHGVTAPFYLASPNQLNVQIPYETPVNSSVDVVVQYNGQSATYPINVVATAPAIFTDLKKAPVPNASAKAGDTITLFVTGAGTVSPAVATGAAPTSSTALASLPKPTSPTVSVTVGGVNAPVAFDGIPAGLVGVMQINYQVPSGLPLGVQPVVVTIGGASSVEANLTITQ